MNLTRVTVPALDAEHEAIHHISQTTTRGQLVGRVQTKEVAEVASLNFAPAELVNNQIAAHASHCTRRRKSCDDKLVSARLTLPIRLRTFSSRRCPTDSVSENIRFWEASLSALPRIW